jgi:excinuclease ABC subunit A
MRRGFPKIGPIASNPHGPKRTTMDAQVDSKHRSDPGAEGDSVRIRGAREHNLKDVSLEIPRPCGFHRSLRIRKSPPWLLERFTRKPSVATSSPCRHKPGACSTRWRCPKWTRSRGLPPAVAWQQQRGPPTTRSSVGSVTTSSNLRRMLYSRAGDYPRNQPLLYAESFRRTRPKAPARIAMVSAVSMRSASIPWCPMTG